MTDETVSKPIEELTPEEPRGRGREKGFVMPQSHRDKIRNSNILNCLIEHVQNERPMEPSQVTAGLGLLKKVFPDLQSVAHQGGEEGTPEIKVRHKIERVIVDPSNTNG